MRSVLISLGSNLGNRVHNLRSALLHMRNLVALVRVSSVFESEPVDCPEGSADFLNMVAIGHVRKGPNEILDGLQKIEARMGRRSATRNAPRPIDLDLILYGSRLQRDARLTLPHPRYRTREFVLAPFRELELSWHDPADNKEIGRLRGVGFVTRCASKSVP